MELLQVQLVLLQINIILILLMEHIITIQHKVIIITKTITAIIINIHTIMNPMQTINLTINMFLITMLDMVKHRTITTTIRITTVLLIPITMLDTGIIQVILPIIHLVQIMGVIIHLIINPHMVAIILDHLLLHPLQISTITIKCLIIINTLEMVRK